MALCGELSLKVRRRLFSIKFIINNLKKKRAEYHPNQVAIQEKEYHAYCNFYIRFIKDLESNGVLQPKILHHNTTSRSFLTAHQTLLTQNILHMYKSYISV